MKFKDVVISEASTEAKVAALALLLDKELIKLADTVLNVKKLQGPKGEQGIQGPKGEQGDRGFDGTNGKDGVDGKDGKDGEDGKQGVGVADAKIDFDGSLVITLTDGTEINAGDVVPLDTAEKIRVIGASGGTAQSVLDAIAAIQATIATYGTMALQNDTSVDINGGAIDGTSIGAAVPATGTFTTLSTGALTATGQTSLGTGNANYVQIDGAATSNGSIIAFTGSDTNVNGIVRTKGAGLIAFRTSTTVEQFRIAHTASAVNYVQVTGAATTGQPTIFATGSDAAVGLTFNTKGVGTTRIQSNSISIARFTGTLSAVNYLDLTHSITGQGPVISAQSISDANTPLVLKSLGTGAIDLAAGSSGVNISNGGTVTAITRTANGSGYTSVPTITVSAPTTAGGVQATVTANMFLNTVAVAGGGTGYSLNDVLTLSGGTSTQAAQITVTAVSAGVITAVSIGPQFGFYSVVPTSPVSVTGGTGSGATFTVTWGYSGPTITNAGSGYVEQPTVSFSGGGGSGAAAYATVGGTAKITGIGAQTDFYTPSGAILSTLDGGLAGTGAYLQLTNSSASNSINRVIGSGTNLGVYWLTKGTGSHAFATANSTSTVQFNVAHTASAVNYVQVTGSATGGQPVISTQGSDANINLVLNAKGSSSVLFQTAGQNVFQATGSGTVTNRLLVTGTATGVAPSMSCVGGDTNIDLALTPKGTGRVKFGTYTANMALTVQGYIEILDSGGTVRKLAVIA